MATVAAVSVYAMDLMDEEDMNEAKKRLEKAMTHGIDRTVWNVYGWKTENYPTLDRGLILKLFGAGKEYRNSLESQRSYILRLTREGSILENENQLHLVKDKISLNFNLQDQGVQRQNEKVKFYDADKSCGFGVFVDIKDVEGIVEVRKSNLRLDYNGWNTMKFFPDDVLTRPRPYEIVFHE